MKLHKYGIVSEDALRHMIGQVMEVHKRGATIAEIACWFGISKPTAMRFIIRTNHGINAEMVAWRKGHSVQYRYYLDGYTLSAYKRGTYYASYIKISNLFMEQVKNG